MIRRPPRSTRTAHSFPTRRSADLLLAPDVRQAGVVLGRVDLRNDDLTVLAEVRGQADDALPLGKIASHDAPGADGRSEEHTSELQSLMRISYAVFCLKKQTTDQKQNTRRHANNVHHATRTI